MSPHPSSRASTDSRFAGEFGSEFHRIQGLARVGGKMRVVELHVRAGIMTSDQVPLEPYDGELVVDDGPVPLPSCVVRYRPEDAPDRLA